MTTTRAVLSRILRACACICVLTITCEAASAHDTWFERLEDGTLALGTGNQFPKRESGIADEYLRRHSCFSNAQSMTDGDPKGQQWSSLRNVDDALLLKVPSGARSCWAQLTPFDIELAPDKIGVYIGEIRPTAAFLSAWADIQRRGLPWIEHYTKHARIELSSGASARPSDMDMDALLQSGDAVRTVGTRLDFVVLRNGKPLPDFNVQFRSERTPFGFWRRTDGDGHVDFSPPLPGRWLLRGVDIRLSPSRPDTFESDFLTIAFDVAARKAAP